MSTEKQSLPTIFYALLFLGVHFIAGRLSFGPSASHDVPSVWLPTGLAIVFLYLKGLRYAPVVFLSSLLLFLNRDFLFLPALVMAAGALLEAIIAAYLIRRFVSFQDGFKSLHDVLYFTLYAVLLSPLCGALFSTVGTLWNGSFGLDYVTEAFSLTFAGHMTSVLVATPFLLIMPKYDKHEWSSIKMPPSRMLEWTLCLLVGVFLAFAIFTDWMGQGYGKVPQPFFLFPLTLWVAWRLGQRGVVIMTILLFGFAFYFTFNGNGYFSGGDRELGTELLHLELFFLIYALTSFFIATAVQERTMATLHLSQLHEELEHDFQTRTEELRLAKASWESSTVKLAEAQEIAEIGSWEWQIPDNEITWSKELYAMYGLNPNEFEASYEAFIDRMHPDDKKLVSSTIEESFKNKSSFQFEHRIVRSDNSIRTLLGKGRVITDENGLPIRMVGTAQDITERKNAEKNLRLIHEDLELRVKERTTELTKVISELQNEVSERMRVEDELIQAKIMAEAANSAKSQFLANMSHEIRTPLGIVLGFSELISSAESDSERQLFAATIRRNTELLSKIIDDILDFSKIEAGHLDIERLNIELYGFLEDLLVAMRPLAEEKGLELIVFRANDLPSQFRSDPTRLRQILINIIGNAIKFTEKGRVEIFVSSRVKKVTESNHKKRSFEIIFSVSDTGPGLSPTQANRLFEPFVQADSTMTRKFGGTGLGLALSRKFAQALGGDVELTKSELSVGSTFTIRIDAGMAFETKTLATAQAIRNDMSGSTDAFFASELTSRVSLQNASVLVVEDFPDNQELMVRILKSAGARVEMADNGKIGSEKALAGNFDVVLMDIQMPVMDGYQAIARLRQQGYQKPIIAITAHATMDERDKSLLKGFNDHICKPINHQLLIDKIAQLI